MNTKWLKPFFIVAGLYDVILAIAFFLFAEKIFQAFSVTLPNHMAYLKFPALLLLIFAAMFFRVASDPVKHRELIFYGIGLKIAYCGTVFGYELTEGIPFIWIPWAWADLIFLILFVFAWKVTGSRRST